MRKLLFPLLFLGASSLMAQTQLLPSQLPYSIKAGSAISIHDPSVVLRDGKYIVWGSHLGVATSSDLVTWTPLSANGQTFRKLSKQGAASGTACGHADAFNVQQITKIKNREGVEVAFPNFNAEAYCSRYAEDKNTWISGNMWAPDILFNEEMQKWCLYMSRNGDHWSSIIVLLTSDAPTGPWTYQGPVVMSGFHGQTIGGVAPVKVTETDYEIATGEKSFAARYKQSDNGKFWPNCIDPCVFYDEEGELWMTYGSWSGGIFMLKLDKTNGLRDYTYIYNSDYASKGASGVSDPYFGRKIAGGYYVSGEGSYVFNTLRYNGLASNGTMCFGQNLLSPSSTPGYTSWQGTMNQIFVGGCSNICAEVADQKLGQAYRVATGHGGTTEDGEKESIDYIESPYSHRSFIDYQDNIYSIKNSLYGTRDIKATTPVENSMLSLLKKMNYSGYNNLVNALNAAIQALETAKNSGKSFVEEPGAQRVKDCIDAVSALDEELNNAGSWINKQDAI